MLIVQLSDSILAFHKYGVQGRSLKNGEITQEIIDKSKTYRLLGSDKYIKKNYLMNMITIILYLKDRKDQFIFKNCDYIVVF